MLKPQLLLKAFLDNWNVFCILIVYFDRLT